MADLDLEGKSLRFEAKGNIVIGKIVNINEGGTLNENYYGTTPLQQTEGLADQVQATPETAPSGIVEELLPIFKGDEAKVRRFINAIKGLAPKAVTNMVNVWVADGHIDYGSRKGVLFEALNRHGIYPLTESTWNKQVK